MFRGFPIGESRGISLDRRRTQLGASSRWFLLVLIGLMAAGEMGLRSREGSISLDLEHIREIPEIVSRLDAAPEPRVLFLGNSLTRYGVEVATVREQLTEGMGRPVAVEAIHPDDTSLSDWHYLYQKFILRRGAKPDVLIVSYALEEVNDVHTLHPERLGRYFGGIPALREVFEYDLTSFDDRATYLLSCYSSIFANRGRIRERALATLIPGYRDAAQDMNEALKEGEGGEGRDRDGDDEGDGAQANDDNSGPPPTYSKLARFLDMTRASGVRTILVAMPQPGPFYVSPDLIATVAAHGAEFYDFRQVEGITDSDFLDGFHLAASGAHRHSEAISQRLLDDGVLMEAMRSAAVH